MVRNSTKCPSCEEQVIREEGIFDDVSKKWLHKQCYRTLASKRELSRYVCALFKLKAPGPKIYSQMNMLNKKGYSYEGMLSTLKYHFDVKKGKVEKAMEGIGIIPFVYEEAQLYYQKLSNKAYYVGEQIAQNYENQQVDVIYLNEKMITNKKEKSNKLIDLNNL